MDVSEEYIKMLVVAYKAGLIKKKIELGDTVWSPQYQGCAIVNYTKDAPLYAVTWLKNESRLAFGNELDVYPVLRQDQLQLLSGLNWHEFDKECLKYTTDTKEKAGIMVVKEIMTRPSEMGWEEME